MAATDDDTPTPVRPQVEYPDVIRRMPYANDAVPMVWMWSEKAGCTSLLQWFLFHTGELDEAQAYSDWIHDWELEVMKARPGYADRLVERINAGTPVYKLVRNPYHRAVSSYLMLHALADDSGHFSVPIRNAIRERTYGDPEVPYSVSFLDTLEWMAEQPVGSLESHLAPQVVELERLLGDVRIVRLEEFADRIASIETEFSMPHADLGAVTTSTHHTSRSQVEMRPEAVVRLQPMIASGPEYRLPPTASFFTPETIELIETIFVDDLAAYGYQRPVLAGAGRPANGSARVRSKVRSAAPTPDVSHDDVDHDDASHDDASDDNASHDNASHHNASHHNPVARPAELLGVQAAVDGVGAVDVEPVIASADVAGTRFQRRERPDHVVVIDLPHTSGEFMVNAVELNYRPDERAEFGDDTAAAVVGWTARPQPERDRVSVLIGAIPFGVTSSFSTGSIRTALMLRQPIDALADLWAHAYRDPTDELGKAILAALTATDRVAAVLSTEVGWRIDNPYVRAVSGVWNTVAVGELGRVHLQQALYNLALPAMVVTVAEQPELAQVELEQKLGWTVPAELLESLPQQTGVQPPLDQHDQHDEHDEHDAAIRQDLREANHLDAELYAEAVDLVTARHAVADRPAATPTLVGRLAARLGR